MHGLHARLPKNFVLEERLERYASYIEPAPHIWAGRWKQAAFPLGAHPGSYQELYIDLGCGKGQYTCELARLHPEALVLGIDCEPLCIAYAAQRAHEEELTNVLFVPGTAAKLATYVAPAEVDALFINFPTPFPRKKQAAGRLTHANMLDAFRTTLAPGAQIFFKTDSQPLFDFSLTQAPVAGYEFVWTSRNLSADKNKLLASELPTSKLARDFMEIRTGYEERLCAQGAQVHAFEIRCANAPDTLEQANSMSLQDYLPSDLSALDYVPHGMQGTVVNLRNQRLRQQGLKAARRRR